MTPPIPVDPAVVVEKEDLFEFNVIEPSHCHMGVMERSGGLGTRGSGIQVAPSPAREGEFLLDMLDNRSNEVDYEVSEHTLVQEDVEDGVSFATPIPGPEEGNCAHDTAVEAANGQEEKANDLAKGSSKKSTDVETAMTSGLHRPIDKFATLFSTYITLR